MYRNLHGTCHRLIGVYAVGSLLSKLIILVPYSLFLFPALFPSMPLFLCTALELLPMMGQISIFPTMLAIGADRVLSIFFPLWLAIEYLYEFNFNSQNHKYVIYEYLNISNFAGT